MHASKVAGSSLKNLSLDRRRSVCGVQPPTERRDKTAEPLQRKNVTSGKAGVFSHAPKLDWLFSIFRAEALTLKLAGATRPVLARDMTQTLSCGCGQEKVEALPARGMFHSQNLTELL